jgi:hypothetical protein
MSDDIGGPYVAIAALCEKALQDNEGRISLINVVDRWTINASGPEVPEQMPQASIQVTMVLSFKSGFFRGAASVKVTVIKPDGEKGPEVVFPALFEGDDRGVGIITNTNFILDDPGLYWINIYVQDELKTRIPLRLVYQRMVVGTT